MDGTPDVISQPEAPDRRLSSETVDGEGVLGEREIVNDRVLLPDCLDLSKFGVNIDELKVLGKEMRYWKGLLKTFLKDRPVDDGEILSSLDSTVKGVGEINFEDALNAVPDLVKFSAVRGGADKVNDFEALVTRVESFLGISIQRAGSIWKNESSVSSFQSVLKRGLKYYRLMPDGAQSVKQVLNVGDNYGALDMIKDSITYMILARKALLDAKHTEDIPCFRESHYYYARMGEASETILEKQQDVLSKQYKYPSPSALYFSQMGASQDEIREYMRNMLYLIFSKDYVVPLEIIPFDLEILAEEFDVHDFDDLLILQKRILASLQSMYWTGIDPNDTKPPRPRVSFWERMEKLSEREGNLKILELGFGNTLAAQIHSEVRYVDAVYGVDVDDESGEDRRRKIGKRGELLKLGIKGMDPNIVLRKTVDFFQENCRGNADVVFAADVLHHMPEKQRWKTLMESINMLKPGGILFIKEPAHLGLVNRAVKVHNFDSTNYAMVSFEEMSTFIRFLEMKGFVFDPNCNADIPGELSGNADGYQRYVTVGQKPFSDTDIDFMVESAGDCNYVQRDDIFEVVPFNLISEEKREFFLAYFSEFFDMESLVGINLENLRKEFLEKYFRHVTKGKISQYVDSRSPYAKKDLDELFKQLGFKDASLYELSTRAGEVKCVKEILSRIAGIDISLNVLPGWRNSVD